MRTAILLILATVLACAVELAERSILFAVRRQPPPHPSRHLPAACCFYRTLFQASPAGLPGAAAQLNAAQDGELHTLADAAH